MSNTYIFNPIYLTQNQNGIVVSVDFTVTVSDDTDSFTISGTTALNAPPATPIPYAQLTKEEVIKWIEALVGNQIKEQADAELASYKLNKNTVLTSGTPW